MTGLHHGVLVVLSGGAFDAMNPIEVRDRMDQYIADIGLPAQLLERQTTPHVHQSRWRAVAVALAQRPASPLILAGHSNGGAAALNVARAVQRQGKAVDLLWTADSVFTLDDNGDSFTVPANVVLNVNTHVIPTPSWALLPFPFGRPNRRADGALGGIVNIGLAYPLPGALAHRNAFYELAGGDGRPNILRDVTLAVLRGEGLAAVIARMLPALETLARLSRLLVRVTTATGTQTVRP